MKKLNLLYIISYISFYYIMTKLNKLKVFLLNYKKLKFYFIKKLLL